MRTPSLLLTITASLAPIAVAADPLSSGTFPLVVNVSVEWRSRVLSPAHRSAALDEAAAVWASYDVQCRWMTSDSMLTLVVDDQLLDGALPRTFPLGWVAFVDGTPDRVVHASAAAAHRLVRSAFFAGRSILELPVSFSDALTARALGRAMAHEIGHWLLASPAHTDKGLMRPTFLPQEAVAMERAAFTLDGEQITRLRHRAERELAQR